MRYADPVAQARIDELESQIAEIRKICNLDDFWRTPDSKVVRVEEQKKGYTVTTSMVRTDDIESILKP